ncbi:MAG: tetratricopeptide repeat protein [Longimicrobiales bacterium]
MMQRLTPVVRLVGVLPVLALAALLVPQPTAAQDRFDVLVPNLEPQGGADRKFGERAADELKKLIDDMATHSTVDDDDLKAALKKFSLNENQLDCIKARQLAIQISVELVLCGQYTGNQVESRFVSAETGEEFVVPAFAASNPKQAAQQIFGQFQQYVDVLRFAQFCGDYLQSQNYASALENCNRAIAINPRSTGAQYYRGRALMEMDSLRESLQAFRTVLELNPAHQDAMLTAGVVAARVGEREQARELFHSYLELNPGNVDVRLQVATDLANAGDPAGALRIAEEGIPQDPSNASLQLYAGHFALAAAEQARQSGANGEQAAVADPAELTRLYETALKYYEAVFETHGDSADATMLKNMINVLTQLERYDEAAALGARIVAIKSDDADILMSYATALNRAGRTNDAIAQAERALAINPQQSNAHALMGTWLIDAGRLSDARAMFSRALAAADGDRDKRSDDFARVVFAKGYNDLYRRDKNTSAALDYWAVAEDYATSDMTRSMINFWQGFATYERATRVQEPNTAASAREALPMFQRALQELRAGQAYARTVPSVDFAKIIDAVNQYIEIQELLIRRGR